MTTLRVDLAKLKQGVRYSFKTDLHPGSIIEGTINKFIPESWPQSNQYIFSNVLRYNPNNKPRESLGNIINFGIPDFYPYDISVYSSTKLPGNLNQFINRYGCKSRKSKRLRKSKRHRYNRKSKKR